MPVFEYTKLEIKPDYPVEGDLYYDRINYTIYIYSNSNWINIDYYDKEFKSYDLQQIRKKKLLLLKEIYN